MSKSARMVTTLLFSICAVGLLLHLLLPDKDWSQAENRPLQKIPPVSLNAAVDGSWSSLADAYWSDQMPGRETFFRINYLLKKYTGTTLLNGVYLCKDRLIGQPSDLKEGIWQNNLQSALDFCETMNLQGRIMIVPSAAAVLKQDLPWQASVPDELALLDEIDNQIASASSEQMASLQSTNIAQTLLNAASQADESDNLYYKTDHHWTSYGAGLAGMDFLNQSDPETSHSLDQYTFMPVSHDFQGTLSNKTGSVGISDTIDIAPAADNPQYMVTWADGTTSSSIYDLDALDEKDQYQLFLGANQSVVRVDTTNTNGRNLLLFKDSYANSMIQFLLPWYQSITIVDPRYYYEDLDLVLSMNDITEAAFIFGYDNFVADASLKDVLSTCDALQALTAPDSENADSSQQETSEAETVQTDSAESDAS